MGHLHGSLCGEWSHTKNHQILGNARALPEVDLNFFTLAFQ
jgi:hypothetical protein